MLRGETQTVWVLVPVLSLLSCVALGKLFDLSVLQLSHLFNENIIGPNSICINPGTFESLVLLGKHCF